MYLIGLNLRGFFTCGVWLVNFDFYQNHVAFWPQTCSFFFEHNFTSEKEKMHLLVLFVRELLSTSTTPELPQFEYSSLQIKF